MPQEDSSATSGTTTSAARLSVNPPAPNNGNNNNNHIQTKSQHDNKNKSKHALELKACQHKLHLHNRPEPMSCHHCRVSKVACDKKRPCSTCIRKGKSCYDYIKPNKDQNLTGGNPSAGNIWQRGKKKNRSPVPATTGHDALADDSVQQHPQQSLTHKRNPIIFVEQFPHIQLQPSKKRKMDLSQTANRHISSRVVNSSDDSTKNKELGGPNNTAELYHHTSASTTTSASTMTTHNNNNNSHSCTTTSTTTMNNNNNINNLFFSSSSSSNREFQSPSSLSSSSCSSSNSTTPPLSNNEYDSIDSIISVDSPGSFQLGLETSSSPSLPMPPSDSTMNMILGSSSSSLSGMDSIELNQHNNHIVPLSSSLSSSYAMTMPNHNNMNQTNHDNHTIYMNHALSSPYLFIPTTTNDYTTVVYNNNNNNNNNSSNTMMTMHHPHHHNNNAYQNRNTLYNPINNNNSDPTVVLHTNSMINNNNNIAPLVDYEDDKDDIDDDIDDDDIVNNQITSLELEIEEMQRTLHMTRRNNEALEEKIRVMQRELQPLKAVPRDFNLDPVDMWNPPLNTRKAVLMWDRASWEIFGCNQVFRDMFRYSRAELQGESPSILSTRISQSLWKDFVNNVWAATAHNVARHGFLVTKDGIVLSTQIHCRIENSFLLVEFELTDVVHDEVVLDNVVYPRTFQIPIQKYAMAATTTEAMSITRMLNIFWNARERITNPVIRQRQEREISKVLALVGGQRLSDEPAQDSEENKQDKCS